MNRSNGHQGGEGSGYPEGEGAGAEYSESFVIVPFDSLEPDTLDAIIEDAVTRDGTDYGEWEASLEQKAEQLKAALQAGQAKLVFEQNSETLRILAAEDVPR